MAFAAFIEGTSPALRNAGLRHQILIVPDSGNSPMVLSRRSNGKKGKGNAWVGGYPVWDLGEELLPPVAVKLTDIDLKNISDFNFSQLGQKAVVAFDKLENKTPTPENVLTEYERVRGLVQNQSPELEALVHDRRRREGSTPTPKRTTVKRASKPRRQASPQTVNALISTGATEELVTVVDPSIAKKYKSRHVAGSVSDFDLLEYAQKNGQNILLLGPTGSGKTMLPFAFASQKQIRAYSVSGNIAMEPSQLFGKFVPDGQGGFIWVDGPVTTLVRFGGVLILDEVNLISPKIYTVLFSLLDARREITLLDHAGETIKAHPDLLIVATGNPGYVGTGVLSEAMVDRWHHRHSWGYDDGVEKALIKSNSLLELVNSARARSNIQTPISTRLMVEFQDLVTGLGYEYAVENFLNRFLDVQERGAVKVLFTTYESKLRADLLPKNATQAAPKATKTYPDYPWDADFS